MGIDKSNSISFFNFKNNFLYNFPYNILERSWSFTDLLSNGFKIRQEQGYGMNNSGITYIYMAWAEHPFNGNGEGAFATAR